MSPGSPARSGISETSASLATLEALYDAYHRQALGLAYRLLGNMQEAEEVVQESFLAAWRASDTFDGTRGSARTWLLSMVRHRSIDGLRARSRRPVSSLGEDVDPPDESDVPALAASHVDGQVAVAALANLTTEQQEVIRLAYFAGLSHSEIATRLAMPLGTVKGRIRLALDHLRVTLGVTDQAPAAS